MDACYSNRFVCVFPHSIETYSR